MPDSPGSTGYSTRPLSRLARIRPAPSRRLGLTGTLAGEPPFVAGFTRCAGAGGRATREVTSGQPARVPYGSRTSAATRAGRTGRNLAARWVPDSPEVNYYTILRLPGSDSRLLTTRARDGWAITPSLVHRLRLPCLSPCPAPGLPGLLLGFSRASWASQRLPEDGPGPDSRLPRGFPNTVPGPIPASQRLPEETTRARFQASQRLPGGVPGPIPAPRRFPSRG